MGVVIREHDYGEEQTESSVEAKVVDFHLEGLDLGKPVDASLLSLI